MQIGNALVFMSVNIAGFLMIQEFFLNCKTLRQDGEDRILSGQKLHNKLSIIKLHQRQGTCFTWESHYVGSSVAVN